MGTADLRHRHTLLLDCTRCAHHRQPYRHIPTRTNLVFFGRWLSFLAFWRVMISIRIRSLCQQSERDRSERQKHDWQATRISACLQTGIPGGNPVHKGIQKNIDTLDGRRPGVQLPRSGAYPCIPQKWRPRKRSLQHYGTPIMFWATSHEPPPPPRRPNIGRPRAEGTCTLFETKVNAAPTP